MNRPWLECDVLVIGAGASGLPAAIGAARAGARVVLLEEDPVPGGAAVDQFVAMPDGGPRSGIVLEWTTRLAQGYALTDRPVNQWWNFWYLPADHARVWSAMVAAEPNLRLVCGARVSSLLVEEKGGRPRVAGAAVPAPDGAERRVRARVTVEATGVGALAERAGCRALYGEDSRADFGEALAPETRSDTVQLCTWQYVSQKMGGGAPLDFSFMARPPLKSGWGWIRSDPEADAPANRHIYLHWGCAVPCADTRDPAALAATQMEALRVMEPELARLRQGGYAVHLAPRIGVRETRRIVGEAVVTAAHMVAGTLPEDSVLVTQRPIDIWRKGGRGMSDYPEIRPYGIPYRALVPAGVDGLLVVGKSMSGTHLAMASYRVQCLLGQIGQAAGVAAALCARSGARPAALDFAELRPLLTSAPQNMTIDPERAAPPA